MTDFLENGIIRQHPNLSSLFNNRVVIRDKDNVKRKLQKFQADGLQHLFVISDFDYTMSRFHIEGTKTRACSCFKILEDCNCIDPNYQQEAQALQRHYYPLEVDPTLDEETRINYMIEWVMKANALLIQHQVSKTMIRLAVEDAIQSHRFGIRKYVPEFLVTTKEQAVPVLIFSAGIADVLEEVLRHYLPFSINTPSSLTNTHLYVISNRCIFNEEEQLQAFEDPVIHVFNKKASSFLHTDFFNRSDRSQRKNLLLVGDSLGDVSMSEGLTEVSSDTQILRIGFLNDRLERLPSYLTQFDIVILDDPGYEVPYGILQAIQNQREIMIE